MKFAAAINQLQISRDTVRNNEPINRREGNMAQARLEHSNAADYTAAIKHLMRAKGLSRLKAPK